MGAINYKRSEYITLATKGYTITEDEAKDYLQDMGHTEEEIEETDIDKVIDNLYRDYEEADYYNASYILKKYGFRYFNIVILSGYYEGLQVDIEINDYGLWAGSEEDFRDAICEAIEEIDTLKKLMIELADIGLQACNPGWVTGWYSYDETLEKIDIACDEIKNDLKEMRY